MRNIYSAIFSFFLISSSMNLHAQDEDCNRWLNSHKQYKDTSEKWGPMGGLIVAGLLSFVATPLAAGLVGTYVGGVATYISHETAGDHMKNYHRCLNRNKIVEVLDPNGACHVERYFFNNALKKECILSFPHSYGYCDWHRKHWIGIYTDRLKVCVLKQQHEFNEQQRLYSKELETNFKDLDI